MMNIYRRNLVKILIVLPLLTLLSLPASALSLGQAKAQGLVGETPSGYLAAVKPSPAVNALIKDINGKRLAAYQNIAKKNGQPLATVQKLAGQKAMSNTPRGQYVKVGGSWKKK
jgi:uncharacterized protein YdbL (DUF1318 family)